MPPKKIKKHLLLSIICLNLLLSGISASHAENVTGTVGITECVGFNCLDINIPGRISSPDINFMKNDGDRFALVLNYPLGQQIFVSDSRTGGGFNVTMDIGDELGEGLYNADAPGDYAIDRRSIGVLSFNNNENEAVSTDSSTNNSFVTSMIDPDLDPEAAQNGVNLTYEEVKANAATFPDNYYTFFPASGSIPLIIAPDNPTGYRNNFTMGLAFLIKTPENPAQTLRDGNYQATITFTLTE